VPRGNQFTRQWRLLQFLGRPQGFAVEEAARELRCTVRTVWRDLRVLQDAGFPIYDERDGRRGLWKVEEGFRDRLPIPLSLPEVVALLVSHGAVNHGGAGPFGPAVASAFGKVRALLTPKALELVDRMGAAVGARTVGAKLQLGTDEHLEVIQRALAEGRTLQMRYYSLSRDAETERAVDPYQLMFFNGALYLAGYCHLRQDVRIFAVDRIRVVRASNATFTRPADFSADAYWRGAWGIVRGNEVTVRVVFSPVVAPHVRGRLWHTSQELRELAGGRLELRITVADTLEVRRWLLGFGAEVEVLDPPALRDAVRREAEQLLATLAPGGARKPPASMTALPPGAPPARVSASPPRRPPARMSSPRPRKAVIVRGSPTRDAGYAAQIDSPRKAAVVVKGLPGRTPRKRADPERARPKPR